MLRGPFLFLALLILATSACPVFLPLATLLGYPGLLLIALGFYGRWLTGRLERPAETAAVWVAYLGLILTLSGITLCFDTALAGQSPTPEQKRFGTGLTYAGGAIAGISAAAAYALDLRRRSASKKSPGPPDLME